MTRKPAIIDLQECSQKTGKPELEIAQFIIKVLAMKADIYDKTQRVQVRIKGE